MSGSRCYWARYHAEAKPDTYPESQAYNERWSALRPIYASTMREAQWNAHHYAPEGTERVQVFAPGNGKQGRELSRAEVLRHA